MFIVFFHYRLVPLYPLPQHNHRTVVHVHESFFLSAPSLHFLTWPPSCCPALRLFFLLLCLGVVFLPCLKQSIWLSTLSTYCLFLPVYYLFQILHSLFLTGHFLWFLCLFFMLLSILIIITLNSLSDKLLASISSSSFFWGNLLFFHLGSFSLSSHCGCFFVFVSMY